MANIYFEKLNENICSVAKKPEPARFAAADWWKSMEKFNYDIESEFPKNVPHSSYATVRNCPAVNDSINFGYTLFNPIDVYIDATNEDSITWNLPNINLSIKNSDDQSFIGFHEKNQFIGFKKDDSYHDTALKLNTFYGIKTEDGYSSWITHPIGRSDLPFRIVDGIIDTDKYPARFPYGFFIKKNFKGIIKAGTPLIQAIPFKREDFQSYIIEKDIQNIEQASVQLKTLFSNSYKKLFWSRKKFS